ncbi:MAG: hypothetical protein WC054_06995 [Candidatus Nanopelagicales bacterium]
MKLIYKTQDLSGRMNTAELEDSRGRRFQWSRRLPVQQVCESRNPHGQGQAEQWTRAAGKHDATAVTKCLEELGLIETRAAMNARVAKEAIGF